MRICDWCEEPFLRPALSRGIFCSAECRSAKRRSKKVARKIRMTPTEVQVLRDYYRDKGREYRRTKPDLMKARSKRYREKHREQNRVRAKAWRVRQREMWLAGRRDYEERKRQQDPAWFEARKLYNREYRRRLRQPCELSLAECASAGKMHKHCRGCGEPIKVTLRACRFCLDEMNQIGCKSIGEFIRLGSLEEAA